MTRLVERSKKCRIQFARPESLREGGGEGAGEVRTPAFSSRGTTMSAATPQEAKRSRWIMAAASLEAAAWREDGEALGKPLDWVSLL